MKAAVASITYIYTQREKKRQKDKDRDSETDRDRKNENRTDMKDWTIYKDGRVEQVKESRRRVYRINV